MRADRFSKVVVVAALGLLFGLVTFGNLTDYYTNFTFIGHVMSMDTVFDFATTRYRAVTTPVVHHLAFVVIIVVEVVATAMVGQGAIRMAKGLRGTPRDFARAKARATAGLTLALVLWQVGLIGLGSEWFGMWMSATWSGLDNAFRYVVMTLGALIYLNLPEDGDASS